MSAILLSFRYECDMMEKTNTHTMVIMVCSFQVYWKVYSTENTSEKVKLKLELKEKCGSMRIRNKRLCPSFVYAVLFSIITNFSTHVFNVHTLGYIWKNDNGTMITLCFSKYTKSVQISPHHHYHCHCHRIIISIITHQLQFA